MKGHFSPAGRDEAEAVFDLIRRRIRWMDQVGIRQWNVWDYWEVFPESYYFKAIEESRLYVLRDGESGEITAAGVLTCADPGWPEDGRAALYLHNFVTAPEEKGAGDRFLAGCEVLARSSGKTALRLDCASDNEKLNEYYASRGFRAVGQVEDGPYRGVLREKALP